MSDSIWHQFTPEKRIEQRWYFVIQNILDGYGRAMAQLDWAGWDIEIDKEKSLAWQANLTT